jgi:hypothetical protein
MRIFLITLFHDKGFGFYLEECVPTIVRAITQCTYMLTTDLILFSYIKVTYTLSQFTIFLGF